MRAWVAKMKEVVPVYFKKYFPYFIVFLAGVIFGGLFV